MTALHLDDLKQYSDVLRAKNGSEIKVRFVEPRDREELQNYIRSLSAGSRYNRFLGALSELPKTELERFVHVGEAGRFTVVATMLVDGFETIVGEAATPSMPIRRASSSACRSMTGGRATASARRCSRISNAVRRPSEPSASSATRCVPTRR